MRVVWIVSGDRFEQQGQIGDTAGNRPRMVETRGQRDDSRQAHTAIRRFAAGDAAIGGRTGDRPSGLRADGAADTRRLPRRRLSRTMNLPVCDPCSRDCESAADQSRQTASSRSCPINGAGVAELANEGCIVRRRRPGPFASIRHRSAGPPCR